MEIAPMITFGTEISKRKVGNYILTETRHESYLRLSKHDHENANFNFVLHGAFLETLGDLKRHSYDCGDGSVQFKPPGEAHSNIYGDKGAHCLILELTDGHILPAAGLIVCRQAEVLFPKIYRELKGNDCATSMIIEGLILQIVGASIKYSPPTSMLGAPRWLSLFLDRLHECFDERLVLTEIADELNVHPVHLQKIFRKYKGCSPGYYLRKIRIQFAANRLLNSNDAIASVALAAGFYDQSHFSRVFKERFDVPPLSYRQASPCAE